MKIEPLTTAVVTGLILTGTVYSQLSKPWVGDITNAASYAEPEAPNGAIAPGSMFVIEGFAIGPSRMQVNRDFPLRTELGGTAVEVTVREGVRDRTFQALMVYTSTAQVAAILPSGVPLGRGLLKVTYNGKVSSAKPVRIVECSFGIFSRNQGGSGPGIVQNYVSPTELRLNGLTQPARPGQVEILWGTGLGAAEGDETAGPVPGEVAIPVEVLVGGRSAKVLYKGRSGCCAGIDQIVFEVPAGIEGCYIPVVVQAGGVYSNFTTMSVAASGDVCPDIPGLNETVLGKLARGQSASLGRVELTRIIYRIETESLMVEGKTDTALGHFTEYPPHRLVTAQSHHSVMAAGMPSPGHCLAVQRNVIDVELPAVSDPVLFGQSRGSHLDAGEALRLTGPKGERTLHRLNFMYTNFLGGIWPDPMLTEPNYLDPGLYTVTNGEGGAGVGRFQTSLELPEPVAWTNRDSVLTVDRREDLTVTWSSANAEDQVVVFYASSWVNGQEHYPTALLCAERATAGQLTVPSWILQQLPPSGSVHGVHSGFGGLISTPTPEAMAPLYADGVDDGRFTYSIAELKLIPFR
jgi:uncharacterized protein (TIGR03437 family)